ncbi:MAG: VWA domain-containing protein, partial [Chloroflexi bacterium]|nr:VWA domain-containing protein [Chloroflexota bacterium]
MQSNVNTTAHVQTLVDGQPSGAQTVNIHTGDNEFTFGQAPLGRGYHTLTAMFQPQDDTIPDNNRVDAAVEVLGQPQVLVVEGSADDGRFLADALTANGIGVKRDGIAGAQLTTTALRPFDALVLANVPVTALSGEQVSAVQTFVQDLGGALIVTGGDSAFGAGGYAQSRLDDLLPVTSARHKTPAVAMDLVIDDSGSMAEDGTKPSGDEQPRSAPEGKSKLDYAKAAARNALSAIQPGDEIGLLAFNASLSWLVPRETLQTAQDAEQVLSAINGVVAGGGTDIDFAITSAYHDLQTSRARSRAIVLLTDGEPTNGVTDPKAFADLAGNVADDGITISTIAIGADADQNLLQNIAANANGRFYAAADPSQVPNILLTEARRVDPPAIVDGELTPQLTGSGVAGGLAAAGQLPHLLAYDAVTAKPLALVGLTTEEGDPLLAQWQIGLGQVVAWTSDVRNRWAADWISQPAFGIFWAQVVRDALAGQIDSNIQTNVALTDGGATLTVNAIGPDGKPRNGVDTQALVLLPDGQKQPVALTQSAPGTYRGNLPADQRGSYLMSVTQQQAGKVVAAQLTSYGVGSPPEYRAIGTNMSKLREIAAAGGGSVLDSAAQAFEHDVKSTTEIPLWPPLVVAALVLFLIEIGTRRFGLATVLGLATAPMRKPPPLRPPRPHFVPGDVDLSQDGSRGENPVGLLAP